MTELCRAAAAKVNASRAHSLDKTANIIESTTIHRAQKSACFWSCRCLIVLISKLALLYPGQEPILIEKIIIYFFHKKRKDRPAHSSINVHWEEAQKPIVCTEVGEAAWQAGGAATQWEHICIWERERKSAAGCFVARQPGTQQMSSCSPGLQRLSSELPLQMTHLPTKQSVLLHIMG